MTSSKNTHHYIQHQVTSQLFYSLLELTCLAADRKAGESLVRKLTMTLTGVEAMLIAVGWKVDPTSCMEGRK